MITGMTTSILTQRILPVHLKIPLLILPFLYNFYVQNSYDNCFSRGIHIQLPSRAYAMDDFVLHDAEGLIWCCNAFVNLIACDDEYKLPAGKGAGASPVMHRLEDSCTRISDDLYSLWRY